MSQVKSVSMLTAVLVLCKPDQAHAEYQLSLLCPQNIGVTPLIYDNLTEGFNYT